MPDLVPVKRALLSVSDKSGLIPFAQALSARGVEILSTGGTARALTEAGIRVIRVADVTGSPEILSGRVKTLHPRIHGAILARRGDESHDAELREHGITPIDLVCVNLYPFERTVAAPEVTRAEAVEQIDIGGPCMVRAAAKNADGVAIVTDPSQYADVLRDLETNDGATCLELRLRLAKAAFARTSAYDAAIAEYLSGDAAAGAFPQTLRIEASKVADLRYGENPHQAAALYRDTGSAGGTVVGATQLHGKALSYNNIADAAAALELVRDLKKTRPEDIAAAVIKHANACGAAVAPTSESAIDAALLGDPLAAFGGILAVAGPIDEASARRCCAENVFLEVIVAESFDDAALAVLRDRWKNIRLLAVGADTGGESAVQFRSITGGVLVQETDRAPIDTRAWSVAGGSDVSDTLRSDAAVVWTVCKHLKSNAVCIGGTSKDQPGVVSIFGVGAGLVDRVSACRMAASKAGGRAAGAIAASDAFFPFADGPGVLIDAGVACIVQPGGSVRDTETFGLCSEKGVACLTTGTRHFRH